MRAHDSRLHRADVIAVFENQDDADEALLQLRLTGFRDSRIGYFAQQANGSLMSMLSRDYAFAGATVGGILGIALGAALAPLVNRWSAAARDVLDLFGISTTMIVFGALFVGLIGWWIGVSIARTRVAAPTIDPAAGPFVLAVAAGNRSEQVRAVFREYGGHELPAGAMTARPVAV